MNSKLNARQLRLVLLGLLGASILVMLAITFSGLSSLSGKSRHLVDLKIQSKAANDQLASLTKAKKEASQYSYFNDIAKTVIPNDKDQAQAVLDIQNLANQSGIALQSVTFPSSNLGTKPSSTDTSAASKNAISQAKPVEGIAGLYSLQLTITPQIGPQVPADKTVTYSKFLNFLDKIEHNRRTAQITQVNIQPQGSDTVNFTLTINIFIKP